MSKDEQLSSKVNALEKKLEKKENELNKYKNEEINHEFDKYFRTVGKPGDIADIAKAVRKVYPYMKTLDKSGYNDYHDYEYVPIDEILEEFNEGISKQIGDDEPGFAVFSTVIDHRTSKVGKYRDCIVKLLITFMHTETGGRIQTVARGIGRDNSEKHMFKAITNAFKYAIKYTFMIAAGGGDPEVDSYVAEQPEQPKEPEKTKDSNKNKSKESNKKQISMTNNNKKKSDELPDNKKKEMNKIKEKWSKHNDLVIEECKKILKKNDMDTSDWSNLKELSVEDLEEINKNIEEEIEN